MTGAVLIVDDSLTVRMDLVEAFQSGGFQAIPCASADEARRALARHAVDAIVLDVLLPDADGVDLLQELRASPEHQATTVLLLSSEAAVKDRVRGLRTGADEYVGKPYDPGYVVGRARQLLGLRTAATGHTTVLLIDDSRTQRMELTNALEGAGYAVITAETGEEGLRIAAGRRPDAIVVDGLLPGVDGATVIRRVRLDAALRDVPCLLLTASTDHDAELSVLDAGADAFVRKEDDVAVLLAKLSAVLRQSSAQTAVDQTDSLHGPQKILAVDDSPTYLDLIANCLRGEGYEVVQARSGEEALELLAAQTVDCILLDLLMPGLGGRETCQRIKAAPAVRDIPLIILTALDEPESMLAGLSYGADDYIQKTTQFDILTARVRAQLRRKHFQDENRRIRDELLRKELETAEARAAHEIAQAKAALADELQWKNSELEAFNYSVSHDLRNPLQVVAALSETLLEDYDQVLADAGRRDVQRIIAAAKRMDDLIIALLRLSHAGRAELVHERVDMSAMARQVVDELLSCEPGRAVVVAVQDGVVADADPKLLRIVLENLIGNAWKYTRRTEGPQIAVGLAHTDPGTAFFVRDNGVGFSMEHAEKLFRPYGRLHDDSEFPGTGIGLATVARIVDRHGGRIWAEGQVDRGSTFYFTTGPA
jgi:DNA-binding response OmpR family regulator